jgi:hypothetical protein
MSAHLAPLGGQLRKGNIKYGKELCLLVDWRANPLIRPKSKRKSSGVSQRASRRIQFRKLTDEQLRQTTFPGWRDDKNAKGVVLELPKILLSYR